MAQPPTDADTRDRLLQAAGQVFADKGFRETTVREICALAGVNVAAVNYHFRGKEALYGETLAFAYRQVDTTYPLVVPPDATAQDRLRIFVVNFLHRLVEHRHGAWHGALIAREIAEPSAVFGEFVDSAVKPRITLLEEAVRELLGPHQDEARVHRCLLSILGQCLMYRHSRSIINRISPELVASAEEIDKTAEHIAAFSLAGLGAFTTKEQ